MIKIEGNYLVIKTDLNHDYDILLSQLKDIRGLQKWLCHMTEKNWWDGSLTKLMIEICEKHFWYKFEGKTHY